MTARNPFDDLPRLAEKWSAPYTVPADSSVPVVRTLEEVRLNPFPIERFTKILFKVLGTPAPKGSKSPKGRRRNGSVILVESAAATLEPWADRVEAAARATGWRAPGPVRVVVMFYLRRPARPAYPLPATKPDVDKLARAVLDALEAAGMIVNDARVVDLHAVKHYAEDPAQAGAHITVERMDQ